MTEWIGGFFMRKNRIYTDLRQLKSHFINMTIAWG